MGLQQDEAQVLVEQGKQQLQWSLCSIALQSFERAIVIDDHCLAAWEGKAKALKKLGKWNEVVKADKKTVSLRMVEIINTQGVKNSAGQHDKLAEQWYNSGLQKAMQGDMLGAIYDWRKAIEIKPDLHAAWGNCGMALNTLGRREEAIVSYDKAIEIDPNFHEAWSNRGTVLYELGCHEEAIASYDKAIEFKHDYHNAWFNR